MSRSLIKGSASVNGVIISLIGSSTLSLLTISLSHTSVAVAAESVFHKAQKVAQVTPSAPVNRPILKLGSEGVQVSELQAALKLLGYYSGVVNGVYGNSTAIAVAKFQRAAGLNPDSLVGAETWKRLFPPAPVAQASSRTSTATFSNPKPGNSLTTRADFPILQIGMQGSAIAGLQQRLSSLGFFKGSVDGFFGSETQTAVKAAQLYFKLNSDGVVGSSTWMALMR